MKIVVDLVLKKSYNKIVLVVTQCYFRLSNKPHNNVGHAFLIIFHFLLHGCSVFSFYDHSPFSPSVILAAAGYCLRESSRLPHVGGFHHSQQYGFG